MAAFPVHVLAPINEGEWVFMRSFGLVAAVLACSVVLAAGAGAANGHASYRAVCPGPVFDTGRCHAEVVTDARGNPQATSGPTGYGPAQFQGAYALPSAVAGAGQTIAIVDAYDDPSAEADLATYSSAYGLPACTTANGCFRKVDQTGGRRYPRADQGWALEISLDVQVARAVCPNCKLLLVEAKSNSFSNLIAAEDYATAHASVVSNSWGGSEFSSETSLSYDGHFNRPGVPITVSSGDAGYGVEFPAASRFVTAVSGTTLTLKGDNSRLSETAWSGAGSGCSSYASKPAWQTEPGCARAAVADVSPAAEPTTVASGNDAQGYQGRRGWFTVGGTSLAAPLIAAVYALAGNAASTTYGSFPYSHTGSLYDVTSGSNGSCGG